MVGSGTFWTAFVAVRAVQRKEVFSYWGFRADNLIQASVVPAILLAVFAAAAALYACVQGTLQFPAHAFLLLLLYSAWGLVQQFLALGIVVRNLELVSGLGSRKLVVTAIGAALFGVMHGPDPALMSGTFLLEAVCIPLYFRHRNLWPLGAVPLIPTRPARNSAAATAFTTH